VPLPQPGYLTLPSRWESQHGSQCVIDSQPAGELLSTSESAGGAGGAPGARTL